MNELDYYRNMIDDIDEKLVELFQDRLEIVMKLKTIKEKFGLDFCNKVREDEVIENAIKHINNTKYESELIEFVKKNIEISRNLQFKDI